MPEAAAPRAFGRVAPVDRPVDRVLDVVFDAPGGIELRADLYLPGRTDDPPPVIVWLHGGAWKFGDRRLGPDFSRFVARRGFAMVSVDYRLSHQARFPAPIEDTKTAVRWVRSVAARYGWDPAAIGLWGSSAGAHLAALAAASGPGVFERPDSPYADQSSHVQAVVAGYAPVDFLTMDEQRDAQLAVGTDPESINLPAGTRSADADSPESSLIGEPIHARPDLARQASPLAYVAAGLPPMLLVHGLADSAVPWRQSELLYAALATAGNDVTLALVDGLGHGFFNRTHLDDDRTWTWRERRHITGDSADHTVTGRLFDRVEDFFRMHLVR